METAATRHPLAIEHLPSFITPPGQTDVLFNFAVIFMVAAIFTAGVLYMRLHALPEHLAHHTQKVQLEIVAVLGLIALFTHNQLFWIAALLLALIDLPDFLSPLRSMAVSLRRMTRGPVATAATAETLDAVETGENAQDKAEAAAASEIVQASEGSAKITERPGDILRDGAASASREGAN